MMKKADVLVVDSHDGELALMSHLYKEKGLAIVMAHSGEEALQILSEYEFDVIVTDICMPSMTGVTFSKKVFEKHPLVMITDHTENQHFDGKIEELCDCYLDKKDLKENLVNATLKAIERHRLNQELSSPAAMKLVA